MRPRRSYFICATPRTGSTLLCALLKSSGVAGVPESYFRAQDFEKWGTEWDLDQPAAFPDFLNAAISAGQTDNGVFAVRIMWGTMDELVSSIKACDPKASGCDLDVLSRIFGEVRFVYLRRLDEVAQAVSLLRAVQTDVWHITGDDAPESGVSPEFHYDADKISGFVAEAQAHNAAWRKWFSDNRISPHHVVYEDLSAEPAGETMKILDFLGLSLPPGRQLAAGNKRISDATSTAWIERFRNEKSMV